MLPVHLEVSEVASFKLFFLAPTLEELHVSRLNISIFLLLFVKCMTSTVFTRFLIVTSG